MNAHYNTCEHTEQLQPLHVHAYGEVFVYCLIFIEPIVRELIQHYLNVACERVYIIM